MRWISRHWGLAFVVLTAWGTVHAATPEPVRIADHWERPTLGLVEFQGSKQNNIIWAEAFVRPGLNADKWHNRSNHIWWGLAETQSPLPGGGKELSFYTNEGYYFESKAARTRRYTCRIDGFVSLHASSGGGQILTKPLLFSGNNLLVNFSTSAAGSMQVQIEDLAGQPVPAFAFSDCPEIYGDAIEHTVKWQRGSDVSTLAGKPIRLRLALRDADLYALGFRDHPK